MVMGAAALIFVAIVAVVVNLNMEFINRLAASLVVLMYGGIVMFQIWAEGIKEIYQPREKRAIPCLSLWGYEAIVCATVLSYGGWHEKLPYLTITGVGMAVFCVVGAAITGWIFKKKANLK